MSSADRAPVKVEIVEIYVPARLEYLSNLYGWLDKELNAGANQALFRGFSLYEVNGAFRGDVDVYEERTIVIRLIFDLPEAAESDKSDERMRRGRIGDIIEDVAQITKGQEEELWLIRFNADKFVRPRRK